MVILDYDIIYPSQTTCFPVNSPRTKRNVAHFTQRKTRTWRDVPGLTKRAAKPGSVDHEINN